MNVEGVSVDYVNRAGVVTVLVTCGRWTYALRELEILSYKMNGETDLVIAQTLGISPSTVRNELQELRDRNSERSTVRLTLIANTHGLFGGFLDELRENVGKWG